MLGVIRATLGVRTTVPANQIRLQLPYLHLVADLVVGTVPVVAEAVAEATRAPNTIGFITNSRTDTGKRSRAGMQAAGEIVNQNSTAL
jgi:hypothetical protein